MHRSTLSIPARWLHRAAASAALVLLPSLALAQQTQVPLPAQNSTFSTNARGFWFTAPADIVITGLRVPTDASNAPQTLEVVRFKAAPRAYPASTNSFTSLFRVVNDASTGILPVSIPVARGEIIGVLGSRGDVSSEAPNPAASTMAGRPVQLKRLGMQLPLSGYAAQNLWTEQAYGIGRVEIHYQPTKAKP
jgi:hypothetical protein